MLMEKRMKKFLCKAILLLVLFTMLPINSFAQVYATLRPGENGSAIKEMQQALTDLGFDTNGIDGKYGKGTERAVKQFQESVRLVADGIAGDRTLTALYGKSNSSSSQNSSSTLRPGATGDAVKKLQQALKNLHYDVGTVDGKYGSGTTRAVKAFQKKNNLPADGIAGEKTFTLLYSESPTDNNNNNTSSNNATLRFGDNNNAVKQMQQALVKLGYATNGTDGKYGKGTQKAVKDFQKNNGLKSDGIAGSATLSKLYGENAVGN
ncbi:MAG: peptidoglycan-binding protein, partial [Clostridiales bacterium]|nr:peptidoglycan-binding protein [Clostridiales bacterium]